MPPVGKVAAVAMAAALGVSCTASRPPVAAGTTGAPLDAAPVLACYEPGAARAPAPPGPVECANPELTAFDSLLVLAPHPDDEVLGFGGLAAAYRELGKPVRAVVVTDGDAYCEACRFWKSSSVAGATCSAAELSNFATAETDSFGEIRRGESAAAAARLGLPPPTFLGYPDTGLGAAWRNAEAGAPTAALRRSDFSACVDCETCPGGYGEGPATELSAITLADSLRTLLASTSPGALVATTHWLDGHADHAALGAFVRRLAAEMPEPRALALAVVHAHTPKDTPHPDCWYPAPRAPACPCMNQPCAEADATWISSLARHRFRPDWPAALPDDADYGVERQLCLPERLWRGDEAAKLSAVRAYRSQLGTLARGRPEGAHPPAVDGMLDCNGYLISFVRRTEAFVLLPAGAAAEPAGAPAPSAPLAP